MFGGDPHDYSGGESDFEDDSDYDDESMAEAKPVSNFDGRLVDGVGT